VIGVSRPVAAQGGAHSSGPQLYDGKIVPARDLAMKIAGPFTFVAVGDLDYVHPIAKRADPSVQAAIKIIRDADVAFASDLSGIVDVDKPGTRINGLTGSHELALDIKANGYRHSKSRH
jgi:hypothetical protein